MGNDPFGLVAHWPDILVSAFLALVGYLLRRDISAMDKRHERAEDKLEELDKTHAQLDTRVTVLEKTRNWKGL